MLKSYLEKWYDEEYCLAAVKQNEYALMYVNREFWHLFPEIK